MEKQWVLFVRHTILHILDTVGIKVSDEKIIMLSYPRSRPSEKTWKYPPETASSTVKISICYVILYYYILSISGVAGLYRGIINRFMVSPVYPFLPLPTSVS